MTHRSGFVNIIGRPNVGKSSLLNALIGERLAVTNPKAQTTRHRIFGIYNEPDLQIVFSDTPGVIDPAYRMQESMMVFVKEAMKDADVFLFMVELGQTEFKDERILAGLQNADVAGVCGPSTKLTKAIRSNSRLRFSIGRASFQRQSKSFHSRYWRALNVRRAPLRHQGRDSRRTRMVSERSAHG